MRAFAQVASIRHGLLGDEGWARLPVDEAHIPFRLRLVVQFQIPVDTMGGGGGGGEGYH